MPPKKNKKPGKNGFWQFVLETRDKQQNRNMTMEDVKNYAARKWANMSKEERTPYEQMALMARDTYRPVKLTTDGLEIEEVERKAKEAENKVAEMKTHILNNMKTHTLSETLADQAFLIIHINHLAYYPPEEKYFICEIAVSAFSLRNGIEEIFHRIVKPGKLPLGFYGGALTHSKETHQLIEIVQEEPFEVNTEEVFFDLIHFMRKYGGNRKLPILYAEEKTHEMITKVFENLQLEFGFNDEIKIYNLQYLFFALKNAAARRQVWPTETFSYTEIEKDVYSYCPNISCEFHEVSDISVYCSKSVVTRYAYTICDNCCNDLNIPLKPGQHVPENAKLQPGSTFGESSNSVRCSVSSRDYEDSFPPLGGSSSSAPSVVSFSSMRTSRDNVTGVEGSLKKLTVSGRTHKNLKFPQHGYKQRDNESS